MEARAFPLITCIRGTVLLQASTVLLTSKVDRESAVMYPGFGRANTVTIEVEPLSPPIAGASTRKGHDGEARAVSSFRFRDNEETDVTCVPKSAVPVWLQNHAPSFLSPSRCRRRRRPLG